MASLKIDPNELGEWRPSNYGYGTEIQLTGEQCEALGITKSVKAGQMVSIRASGIVTKSTEKLESEKDSGGRDISLCIQLTDMTLTQTGTANAAKAAEILYGKDED